MANEASINAKISFVADLKNALSQIRKGALSKVISDQTSKGYVEGLRKGVVQGRRLIQRSPATGQFAKFGTVTPKTTAGAMLSQLPQHRSTIAALQRQELMAAQKQARLSGGISLPPTGGRMRAPTGRGRATNRGILGGFGMYMAGGMIGGQAGMLGTGLMMGGGAGGMIGGGALLAGGAAYKGGMAAARGAAGIGGLFGISKQGFEAFAEFEKALFVTARNLGETFDTSTMNKLKKTISDVATTFGGAGTIMDFAMMAKRIAGSGIIPETMGMQQKTAVIKNALAGAARLSLVSEGAQPEEVAKGLAQAQLALRTKGLNVSQREIEAGFFTAGRLGPVEIEDIVKNASAIAVNIAQGGSLGESLATMTHLGRVGFTPGMAATATRRMREKMSGDLSTAQRISDVTGISRPKVTQMPVIDVIKALSKEYKGGGFPKEEYAGFLKAIFKDIRGARGIQMLAANMDETIDLFDKFNENFKDETVAYTKAIREASGLAANQYGNFKNAVTSFQLTTGAPVNRVLGSIFGTAASVISGRTFRSGESVGLPYGEQGTRESITSVINRERESALAEGNQFGARLLDILTPILTTVSGLVSSEENFIGTIESVINVFGLLIDISEVFLDAMVGLAKFMSKITGGEFGTNVGRSEELMRRNPNMSFQKAYGIVTSPEGVKMFSTPENQIVSQYMANRSDGVFGPVARKDIINDYIYGGLSKMSGGAAMVSPSEQEMAAEVENERKKNDKLNQFLLNYGVSGTSDLGEGMRGWLMQATEEAKISADSNIALANAIEALPDALRSYVDMLVDGKFTTTTAD
jgi:hypothetical protein